MESLTLSAHELGTDFLREKIKCVSDLYIKAAEQYLGEDDLLRKRIVDFYSKRTETEEELLRLLSKKSETEIDNYIQNTKIFTNDPTKFIEGMEKMYTLQDVRRYRREVIDEDYLATEEEYMLGAYAGVLEPQIRDAIFTAQKKGYRTFQSGFKEKNERDQFIDFYNKKIIIPDFTIRYLQEKSIQVKVETFDDRTTLTLHPIGDKPIRLYEWKEVWDRLIDSLPLADPEMVPNMKLPGEHISFRSKQDQLKTQG